MPYGQENFNTFNDNIFKHSIQHLKKENAVFVFHGQRSIYMKKQYICKTTVGKYASKNTLLVV